jgi:hypothetical protein
MIRKTISVAICMFVGMAYGQAAGPYDGTWKGHSRSNDNCKNAAVQLNVANGTVSPIINHGFLEKGITYTPAQVGPDGKVTLPSTRGGKRGLDIVFSGDKFELHTEAACGEVTIIGRRVSS